MAKRHKLEKHHIIPRSRGGKDLENIVIVAQNQHKFYHNLFGNRVPEEIIEYLNRDFWGGKYKIEIYEKDTTSK